ncbi:MAG TPA: two-component regulator propeller domain-containing protein [Flavobacteriales bacterium]|nr:two-component regulator propeller domain-containing protein [Flavobacteriales bacterium]
MKWPGAALILVLFFQSCSQKEQPHVVAENVNPEPQKIELNLKEGYAINQFSGDSSNKDIQKIITGKPFEAKGKMVPAGEPRKVKAGKPVTVSTNLNVHVAGNPLVSQYTNSFSCSPGKDTFNLPETFLCKGKKTKFTRPESVPVLMPRLKDNANCNVQYLDVDQGLNTSYVWQALEDKNGNIWFATNGGGVNRYDGQRLTFYTQKEGMSSNVVWCLDQDAKGNFWFGTIGGGVTMFDGQNFTHFTEKQGLAKNDVRSILADSKGNVWIGTYGNGLDKFDGKKITHYSTDNGLSANAILSLYEDKAGHIWIGTEGGGACKFNGTSFEYYTQKQGLNDKSVLAFLEDNQGRMWFGTEEHGVSIFDGKQFVSYTQGEGLSLNDVRSITQDHNGNIWIGTNGGGACRFDGTNFTWYGVAEGVTDNTVWSVMEDKTGNLWFCTFGGGICKYNDESFKYYTQKEGLVSDLVVSILERKDGSLWFGNNGGALTKYDGKQFYHYGKEHGLSSEIHWSLLEDTKGDLWIGSGFNGLTRFDGEYFYHYTEKEGLSSSQVPSILQDREGNMWFGTNGGGLNKFDGNTFTHFTTDHGLSKNAITCLYQDRAGNIWIGTGSNNGGGVIKFDGKNFTIYSEKEGLPANFIRCITQDKYGNMWFGTRYGGLARFDGTTFTVYSENEGLTGNDVRSLKEDANGFLWVSTVKGLNAIDNRGNGSEKRFVSTPIITTFQKADGLKALDFLSNSFYLDSKNTMWWGTGKALANLNLATFRFPKHKPVIQLTNVEFQEKSFDYRNLSDTTTINGISPKEIKFKKIKPFENFPVNPVLPNEINHITFHYSGTDWKAPFKLRYEYILEGADERWSNLTSETKADYRNLSYGNYTFKVRAIGAANKWSKTMSYAFTINRAWYQTTLFRTLMGFSLIVVVYAFFRLRTRALRERQRLLKRLVDERTVEVIEQKKEAEIQRDKAEEQKLIVQSKQKEITDSINYARRIQYSLLAQDEVLQQNLPGHFVFFKPKDIVSGDFYWATKVPGLKHSGVEKTTDKKENQPATGYEVLDNFYLAVCDSTGHGVPGAFISLLNISFLNEAINEKNISAPNEVFNYVRQRLVQNAEVGKDGMDGTLIRIKTLDVAGMREIVLFDYASANNRPVVVRNGELIDLNVDKMPVGKGEIMKPFNAYGFPVKKGDMVYLYSDGFGDQFGGPKGKKYKVKRLQKFLLSIHDKSLEEQKQHLYNEFNNWKGDLEQVDDVCVVGVRI